MAKKKGFVKILSALLMLIVGLAIGGAFVNGMFTGVFLLKYLPLLVHQIVGWIVIIGSFVSGYHYIK